MPQNQSRERVKILQMVAEGTISPEEAEELMAKLGEKATGVAVADPAHGRDERPKGPLKFLRVLVESGEDKVNVRVPIALIRTGIKLTTLMPEHASEHLDEHGIDLSKFSELDGEELMEALRELWVEIESEDGDTVRVFCE